MLHEFVNRLLCRESWHFLDWIHSPDPKFREHLVVDREAKGVRRSGICDLCSVPTLFQSGFCLVEPTKLQ